MDPKPTPPPEAPRPDAPPDLDEPGFWSDTTWDEPESEHDWHVLT